MLARDPSAPSRRIDIQEVFRDVLVVIECSEQSVDGVSEGFLGISFWSLEIDFEGGRFVDVSIGCWSSVGRARISPARCNMDTSVDTNHVRVALW